MFSSTEAIGTVLVSLGMLATSCFSPPPLSDPVGDGSDSTLTETPAPNSSGDSPSPATTHDPSTTTDDAVDGTNATSEGSSSSTTNSDTNSGTAPQTDGGCPPAIIGEAHFGDSCLG